MANKNATKSGSWSDPTMWSGGTLPGTTDDVYANNFTVTIDQSITVNTLRTTSGTGITAGGGFQVTTGSPTITVTAGILAGTHNGVNSSYILTLSGGSPIVVANVTGGGATSRAAIIQTGTANLTIVGTVTGGTTSAGYGVVGSGGTCTVQGSLVGGQTAAALVNNASFVLIVTGNVTGGATTDYAGIYINAAGTVEIQGDLSGGSGTSSHGIRVQVAGSTITVYGDVTGGSGTTSYAVHVNAAVSLDARGAITATGANSAILSTVTAVIRCAGEITWRTATPPVSGAHIRGTSSTVFILPEDTSWPADSPAGTDMNLSLTGTDNPAIDDVRDGVTYGSGGMLSGTLAVPPPTSVAAGVPTDDTVGTATLDRDELVADLIAAHGAQIATATSG